MRFSPLARFHWVFEKEKHRQTATPSPQNDANHAVRKILVSIGFSRFRESKMKVEGKKREEILLQGPS